MADFYDRFKWLALSFCAHPFVWGFEIDHDARDKSLAVTVGPITVGINW